MFSADALVPCTRSQVGAPDPETLTEAEIRDFYMITNSGRLEKCADQVDALRAAAGVKD